MKYDHKRAAVPAQPGVYLMKDSKANIIYIGKAKSLRNRVSSYFTGAQNYKTKKLVEKIADIEFVLTDSEGEAFVLESNLIKRYRPMYNIELKDQQRYTYLRVTDEELPRLLVARRMRSGKFIGKGRIYGPFTHGSSKLLTIGTLRKSFKVRICKTLPKTACLEYHLGNCEAPCEIASAKKDYAGHIKDLESVLKGGAETEKFATKMKDEMGRASESQDYERAMEIRDTLRRLGSLRTDQKMEYARVSPDEDYFGMRVWDQSALVMSLRQVNGVIRDRDRFSFDLVADNTLGSFLYQYYTTHKTPRYVVTSEEPPQKGALEKALTDAAGRSVSIVSPSRGRRKKMIELILRNIDLMQTSGTEPALEELGEALGLGGPPRTIECFDISNHGADFAVGAMSRLSDGAPDRSGYRKFKIRTVSGRDDYAMIAEVVRRRYMRLLGGGGTAPDLVLIDGGKGQLGAALGALKGMAARIPCVSLAKKNEEVFRPGSPEPLVLPRTSPALGVLRHARDEAHRFGVEYNRKLRSMAIKSG
ncbi:excinuclease nuclease subunit [Cenarchaeum symbiosum A]|uniref:Excinuclease nuclease subunit n=1 Tax=Cenarchaeum symbiosum (strain A) TaxID=414004 RepID=A0RV09_CENSY|nr:excinuclease nuclease subunit [Cenarchaeum symbiosum A]